MAPEVAKLLVVGSANLDLQLHIAHMPRPGETLLADRFARSAGGKGANQAAAAARLGAHVRMLGAIGRDDAATLLEGALRQAGVDTSLLAHTDEPTGTAAILLTRNGQNSIIVAPGANHALTPRYVRGHAAAITQVSLVLTQLETPLAVLEETLSIAGEAAVPVMLDPAPAAHLSAATLTRVSWFTPNAQEAAFYLRSGAEEIEQDPRQASRALQALGPRNILLKLGARGAGVLTHAGQWHFASAVRVALVDTTGAGDTMNAAFAVALAQQEPMEAALRYAVAAASLSVTRAGALASAPTREELARFLRAAPGA